MNSKEAQPLKTESLGKPENDSIWKEAVQLHRTKQATTDSLLQLPDSAWVELKKIDDDFILDLRYATKNNFTNSKLYDCGQCWVRNSLAKKLMIAHKKLKTLGFRIKLLDCYRPLGIQWKLWNTYPDRRYVADPNKGSMHNRGLAIDITIADEMGGALEMGTPYDFFGKEAHHASESLFEEEISNRRKLLYQTMIDVGLKPTSTEWWHYSDPSVFYSTSNWEWNCKE